MKMEFKKGDILSGTNKDAKHPIIFYEERNSAYFEGFMLTHSNIGHNIPFTQEFIKTVMEGIDEPFQYDNTYIVDAILDKKQYWAPFYKTGELTDAGIAFIEKIREGKKRISWKEYVQRQRNE